MSSLEVQNRFELRGPWTQCVRSQEGQILDRGSLSEVRSQGQSRRMGVGLGLGASGEVG